MKIFCFGDSITHGSNDLVLGGWVNRLNLYLENKPDFEGSIFNLGISGETTKGLIERFNQESKTRIKEKDVNNIFIFAYGANDSAIINESDSFKVDVNDFKENLIKAITEAKKFSSKIFILTITPVVEESAVISRSGKYFRSNDYIKKYNDKIEEIVKEQNIEIIDINSVYTNKSYKDLFTEDGLHPNDKGHELIFKTVVNKII
ncbi:MAG: GDSL-type esterase/lipase family protein [Patescibacteria group bacterium]|nr:GDSL-type esterase/lipase family protein [Patescibacteria group bacterium]